jgi:hypothetical protein
MTTRLGEAAGRGSLNSSRGGGARGGGVPLVGGMPCPAAAARQGGECVRCPQPSSCCCCCCCKCLRGTASCAAVGTVSSPQLPASTVPIAGAGGGASSAVDEGRQAGWRVECDMFGGGGGKLLLPWQHRQLPFTVDGQV